MPRRPGQNPGHASSSAEVAADPRSEGASAGRETGLETAPGWGWRDYVASLVAEHGTLAALAWKLVERGDGPDDVASVERALRRLRERGQRDGGVWGQRLLRRFGVPRDVEARLRWMGLYHTPFNDLPLPLCEDQLRLWDQPPISASRARVWLRLGGTSVALRRRALEEARAQLDGAAAALAGAAGPEAARHDDARIEHALALAYVESRAGAQAAVSELLDRAGRLLADASIDAGDRACFAARLVDQRAFQLNRRKEHAAALDLYRSLPSDDVHPFASYRRAAGLAFGCLQSGAIDEARRHAQAACDHAGDGGYTRLRVMALLMLARVDGPPAAAAALARAGSIATRLGDEELLSRVARSRAQMADRAAAPRPILTSP